MEITAVLDRVGRIGAVRADDAAGRVECESALVELRGVRAWVDASEADLVRRLAAMVSFPEQAIAEIVEGFDRSGHPGDGAGGDVGVDTGDRRGAGSWCGDGGSCGCDHPGRQDPGPGPA